MAHRTENLPRICRSEKASLCIVSASTDLALRGFSPFNLPFVKPQPSSQTRWFQFNPSQSEWLNQTTATPQEENQELHLSECFILLFVLSASVTCLLVQHLLKSCPTRGLILPYKKYMCTFTHTHFKMHIIVFFFSCKSIPWYQTRLW